MTAQIDNPHVKVYDPNNTKHYFQTWLKNANKHLKDLNPKDRDVIVQYIEDMKNGINVQTKGQSKKGCRSYARLLCLSSKLPQVARWIKQEYNKRLIQVDSEEVIKLFNKLRTGEILSNRGKPYKSWDDYAKDFKAFWNWWVRYNRRLDAKNGTKTYIPDVVIDLDDGGSATKPSFHYIDDQGLQKLFDNATFKYKVMMEFMIDTGCRSPSELQNVLVSDIKKDKDDPKQSTCTIRDEVSKTFGRTFKLMLCYNDLKKWIKDEKLKGDDRIFKGDQRSYNSYLKRLGYNILKIGNSKLDPRTKQQLVSDGLTLYDFRHNSACYWLPRYKTESALLYRFGWRTRKMVEYYTQFLGMKDTITEDDMLLDAQRTNLEQDNDKLRKDMALMQEQFTDMQKSLNAIKVYEKQLKKHAI